MKRVRTARGPRPLSDDAIAALVEEILEALPPDLAEAVENVGIHIEELPTRELLAGPRRLPMSILGLYVGVPLPQQSVMGPAPIPAQIFLFRQNIERYAAHAGKEVLIDELRRTLIHEIGHHLGLNEEDLRARGL